MAKLTQVVKQLHQERSKVLKELSKLDAAIQALNGSGASRRSSSGPRRVMSAAARRKIAKAQKERWAKWKAKQKKAA